MSQKYTNGGHHRSSVIAITNPGYIVGLHGGAGISIFEMGAHFSRDGN